MLVMSDNRSKPNTPGWYENFDRIFRRETTDAGQTGEVCRICGKPGTDENPIVIGHVHIACHDAILSPAVEAVRRTPRGS